VLRLGVVALLVSAVGLTTQYVGENVLGVLVGAAVSVALLAAIGTVGAQGPTTVFERVFDIRVSDLG
jgi:hypothetical protein